ncbi:MAG: DNA-directed DNA polymerase II small subunit [Archaeoglobaceae archaeon]|nr:DNA-directed DNA polymerase II small subunit [Archaeoglobaceae archaeon]MDW8127792.1 DNA-directed DNA polymerase II small subunit [Archaeoglobaceae archaeon]
MNSITLAFSMSVGGQRVVKNIDAVTVAKKFLVRGYNISPEAAKLICSSEDPEALIEEVCRIAKNKFIIGEEDVLIAIQVMKRSKYIKEEKKETHFLQVKAEQTVKVLKEVKSSIVEGKVEDFVAYFNSRLEKISKILRSRVQPTQIKNLGRFRGESVSIIGMVSNVVERKEYFVIELEDQTGSINCIADGKNAEVARELLGDEVIGVTGTLRGNSILVDRIIFPDVPVNGERKQIDFGIAFISDTHFGSKDFLEEKWKKFVEWLNCESPDEKLNKIAEKIRYVILAGDIVDGVGVYPEQEKELAIIDIYQQYEFAAEHLDGIRKDLQIVVAPGNHDAVRQAEPQPPLPKEFESLFPKNVVNVGNPVFLDLNGLKVLVYHGRSLDDIVTKIPRLSYDAPHKGMEELLKRRHLCPLYGSRSPIAPEKEDNLVIEEIPDVIHSGHVHTFGIGFYRGVFLVNSSTWQSQTEFQKKVNLKPMPCNVAVYIGDKIGKLSFDGG